MRAPSVDEEELPLLDTENSIAEDENSSSTSVPAIKRDVSFEDEIDRGGATQKFDNYTDSIAANSYRPSVVVSGTHLLSEKISRVERSWYIISDHNRIGAVGEGFFLKMFDEHPELVQLFPFGDDSIHPETGKLKLNDRTRKHVRAHASAVMRTVGTCVAGLSSIEDLVPRLRSVGATHKAVGVQNMHYDILYRHLVAAIREEVGSQNWDQETEDAWEQAFLSITDLIKKPSKRLDTEPLRGWGIILLVSCVYFSLVTPFRFAGFYIGHRNVIRLLDILDTLGATVMFLDFMVDFAQSKFRILSKKKFFSSGSSDESSDAGSMDSSLKKPRRSSRAAQPLHVKISRHHRDVIKSLQRWKMDRWVPWPTLDIKVLASFVLQGVFYRGSLCSTPGLHWTQMFGLLRVSCVYRVLHFLQCAENNALLDQTLDADRQLVLKITKLLVRLAFITHVSACMWCAVARVELGPEATVFSPSAFFPDPELLYSSNRNVFNSYTRAIHWAFVNLSGIGGVESVPSTSLECWCTLAVHMVGAIFYAVVTGNVITVLEATSDTENKIGTDIVRLSNYLKTARVSKGSQDRIMKGYMLRNVLTEGSEATGPVLDGLLDSNDEVLGTLPNYLRLEVGIYARAEVIRRRDKFFTHCSNGFLVALSTSLSRTQTLLPGDYLLKKDEVATREFGVIESGTLQIRQDGHTVQTLRRGDCIGKSWLIQMKNRHASPEQFDEETDWLKSDGRSGVSIRALSACVILNGLSSVEEINVLERGYIVDFKLLRAEARGRNIDENERKVMAMRGITKAVRLFKQRRARRLRLDNKHKSELGKTSDSSLIKEPQEVPDFDRTLHNLMYEEDTSP